MFRIQNGTATIELGQGAIRGSAPQLSLLYDSGGTASIASFSDAKRVGMGTSSPLSILHVTTAGSVLSAQSSSPIIRIDDEQKSGAFLRYEDGVGLHIGVRAGSTDATSIFVAQSDGSVGIGHTAPSTSLDVFGSLRAQGDGITYDMTSKTGICTVGRLRSLLGAVAFRTTSPAATDIFEPFIYSNEGTLTIQGSGSGTARNILFRAAGSTRMVITNAGRIGIGTESPAYPLQVSGGTTQFHTVRVGRRGTDDSWAQFGHASLNGDGNEYAILHNSNGQLLINSSKSQGIFFRHNNADLGAIVGSRMVVGGTGGDHRFFIGNSLSTTNEILCIRSRRFSGIHIDGDTANLSTEPGGAYVRLTNIANSVIGYMSMIQTSGQDGMGGSATATLTNSMAIMHQSNFPLHIATNNTVRMTIAAGGNVGIGTTAPQMQLHVTDKVNIRGGVGPPSTGERGGEGTRIVLVPGDATTNITGAGIDSGTLWYSAPGGFEWWLGTHRVMTMSGNTLTMNGIVVTPERMTRRLEFTGLSAGFSTTANWWHTVTEVFYTPVSTGRIFVYASLRHEINGHDGDWWGSRILINNTIAGRHQYNGTQAGGGGGRGTSMFPIYATFLIGSTSLHTISIQVCRHGGDDAFTAWTEGIASIVVMEVG